MRRDYFLWGGFVAGDCHEGTKAQRNTKVLPQRKEVKEIAQRGFFVGGFVAGDCHEGTKAQRNTKVLPQRKEVKEIAQRGFLWEGLLRVIATKALRRKETRRFCRGEKKKRRLRRDDFLEGKD